MSVVELSIHNTSRVSVNTREIHPNGSENGYITHTVIIHYTDDHSEPAELCLTLYGLHALQGVMSVPFEFSEKGVGK